MFAYAIHSSSDLRLGDHIVYQSSRPPFRIRFVSALIVGHQEENSVETITNGVVGVTKRTFHFTELKNLHGIKYDSCRYSEEESVERANARFRLKENCYHTLYNNSHFFVTWCKTGREYPLTDVLVEISQGKTFSTMLFSSACHNIHRYYACTNVSAYGAQAHLVYSGVIARLTASCYVDIIDFT